MDPNKVNIHDDIGQFIDLVIKQALLASVLPEDADSDTVRDGLRKLFDRKRARVHIAAIADELAEEYMGIDREPDMCVQCHGINANCHHCGGMGVEPKKLELATLGPDAVANLTAAVMSSEPCGAVAEIISELEHVDCVVGDGLQEQGDPDCVLPTEIRVGDVVDRISDDGNVLYSGTIIGELISELWIVRAEGGFKSVPQKSSCRFVYRPVASPAEVA
jgi:hypothetical protein